VPRPLRLDEVRCCEYIEVDQSRMAQMRSDLNNWWGNQIPITLCVRCRLRYTEDPNRDAVGEPMHENPEDDLEVLCKSCDQELFGRVLRADVAQIIDERYDLSDEEKRNTLKKVVELAVTDQDKFLELTDLSNRVRHLESQNTRLWNLFYGGIITLLVLVVTLVIALIVAAL
jgi:hypothetical protein